MMIFFSLGCKIINNNPRYRGIMTNNEATRKGNAILVFVAMGLGVLIGLMLAQSGGLKRNPSPQSTLQGKMDEVMTLVETNYGEFAASELDAVVLLDKVDYCPRNLHQNLFGRLDIWALRVVREEFLGDIPHVDGRV